MLALVALAYAVVQVCAILAAINAVFYARSAQGATAWAIGLIAAPVFALPLYLLFGRNRFVGYVDSRRSASRDLSWMAEQARTICADHRSTLPKLGGRLESLEKLAHMPFTRDNQLDLLIDGEDAFASMFDAIENARTYILIQFFIVRDDDLGRRLRDLLVQRAEEGIKVYFLYDEIGSSELHGNYRRKLRAAGARMEAFGSSRGIASRFQLNFRNHRKTLVVDGDIAFVGGLNVGDEYLGKNQRIGTWRDTHVRIEGPAADAVQLIFAEDWYWATRHTIEELRWQVEPIAGAGADVLILPSGPADEYETCNLMFVQAIHAAEQRFWIASPYFVPNDEVMAALKIAGLRGVDVRILLPANPDHFVVYLASFSKLKATGGEGIRYFRYTDGFMHQKAFLIDDRVAGVGTANLDNRSFRLNFEITMVTLDRSFAADVASMFERDFASSHEVRYDEIDRKSIPFRVGAAAARLFSPIL